MQNKCIRCLFFIVSFLAMPSLATEATLISLANGKVIKLNSDFTWEYVGNDSEALTDKLMPSETAATLHVVDSDSLKMVVTTPTLSTDIVSTTHSDVTTRNDIHIALGNSQWENQRLGLTFELASKSPDNYVVIELAVSLYSDAGELIRKETINVWQATFRLPETYLRKGQVRKSRTFWFEDIDKQKWTKKLITIEIVKMESR